MNTVRRHRGFTLIEVLIVVVIMAVLAATIIPQFSSSTKDAQTSTVKFNAHTLRSQIELYKAHHLGTYPTIQDGGLPQLTASTDVSGTVGAAGPTFPFGPYLEEVPANPFNNLKTVGAVPTPGTAPTTGSGATGWQYDVTTGNIYPNHTAWTP